MIRFIFFLLFPLVALAGDLDIRAHLAALEDSPHLELITESGAEVTDYEVGLGTLKKVRGAWQFKDSERLTGRLDSFTWQIHDGYTAREVLEGIEGQLAGAELLFSCDGRACGSGAQWANRVFGERLLYGREDKQRYRVYRLKVQDSEQQAGERQADEQWLQLYATSRTSTRQYLHAQVLELTQ